MQTFTKIYSMAYTENKIQDIILGFSDVSGFPDTIGAIDGTHINIPAPTVIPEAYVNR